MAYQYGTVQRAQPRIEVLRGYDPQNPTGLTSAAPVATGVTVKSGQVISLNWNSGKGRYEWVLGGAGDGSLPHFALNDSADEDVISADSLVGLSCAGDYELQTPYYKTGDTYNAKAPLSYDGVTGDVKVTTIESGEPIIGYVSRQRGLTDITGKNSSSVGKLVVTLISRYAANSADAT